MGQRNQSAHAVAGHSGQGGPGDAQIQQGDKDIVQHHIGGPGSQGKDKSCVRPLRRHKEALEGGLEHKGDAAGQEDPAVGDAVCQQQVAGPGQADNRLHEDHAQQGQNAAQPYHAPDKQREVAVGFFPVPLPQGPGHNGAAAGAQHEAKGAHDHGNGHDDIYRRQSQVPYQVGHKQAVHHAVQGGDHHHDHRGQGKAQQTAEGKMIGKTDFHRGLTPPGGSGRRQEEPLSPGAGPPDGAVPGPGWPAAPPPTAAG